VLVLFRYATSSATPPTTAELEICGNADALQLTGVGGKNVLDIFQPTYASEVKVFNRGNHQSEIGFVVTKLHATGADANTHAMLLAVGTSGVGVLWKGNVDDAPNGSQWAYIKGGFTNTQVKIIGATTISTFAFVGGKPSSSVLIPDPK